MRPDCTCGHPYVAHHGPGPCIAVISTAKTEPKAITGKVGFGSVCNCQKYQPTEEA